MKRVIILLFAMLFFAGNASAIVNEVINAEEYDKIQNHISKVGFHILNSNGIDKRMVFFLDSKRYVNAYAETNSRVVYVYRGLYNMLESEDELAAVLGHEISHQVDSYEGPFRGLFSVVTHWWAPRKYEYMSDKRAVDYMVNAGYNPVASIVVLNKITPQNRYEFLMYHPLTTRRMMVIYEYIYNKYPEYLVNNKYKNNPIYQNFLLVSKENREKFQEKVKTNSNKKIRYK